MIPDLHQHIPIYSQTMNTVGWDMIRVGGFHYMDDLLISHGHRFTISCRCATGAEDTDLADTWWGRPAAALVKSSAWLGSMRGCYATHPGEK